MIGNFVPTTPKAQGWVLVAILGLAFVIFWSMKKNGQINLKSNPATPAI